MVNKTKTKKILIFLLLILAVNSSRQLQSADVEFPLVQSMAYFPYSDNHTLEKNRTQLSLNLSYANIYMFDPRRTTINDMEMLSSTVAFRYGFSSRLTFELYYRAAFTFGGIMDRLIINFHELFGLPEGDRDKYPPNAMNYKYKRIFAYETGQTGHSPVVLSILANLYSKRNFRINGRLALGIPISSKPGFSSNKPFYTAGIICLYKGRNITIDFSNHLSLFKPPDWLADEDLRNRMFHSHIRVDFKRFFGGILYRGSPFKTGDLANRAYQVYIGFKIWKYLEFTFVEELPPLDTAPDVSFNLKIDLSGLL